jgi:hypothetical protein
MAEQKMQVLAPEVIERTERSTLPEREPTKVDAFMQITQETMALERAKLQARTRELELEQARRAVEAPIEGEAVKRRQWMLFGGLGALLGLVLVLSLTGQQDLAKMLIPFVAGFASGFGSAKVFGK